MQPITDQGEVKKLISFAGEGESPKLNQEVLVNYIGKLESGSIFDQGKNFKFTLGIGQVIKGWDVGVATMKKGEKADLWISYEFAYGEKGSPPKIPSKANLIFTVTLLDFMDKLKDKSELTEQENIENAKNLKEKGNLYFKNGSMVMAEYSYSQGMEHLKNVPEISLTVELKTLKIQLMSNIAMTNNKMLDYELAISNATKVLEINSQYPKAMFTRATAYFEVKKFEEAAEDFKVLLQLNPLDEAIKNKLQMAQYEMKKGEEKEKDIYKKMFSGKD